jgi:hypothetical protein
MVFCSLGHFLLERFNPTPEPLKKSRGKNQKFTYCGYPRQIAKN